MAIWNVLRGCATFGASVALGFGGQLYHGRQHHSSVVSASSLAMNEEWEEAECNVMEPIPVPAPSSSASSGQSSLPRFSSSKPVFSHQFKPFMLGQVINLSEDTAVFRFLLHNPDDAFDLPACSTLQASWKEGAQRVDQPMRFYTPITVNGTKGHFDIIVRKYPNGRFTEHLFSMHVGECLLFRCLQYKLRYKPNKWDHIGLIGGGTGITPLLQVIRASTVDPQDRTKLSLLFASRSESKILLKGTLDGIQKQFSDRFKIHYMIDKPERPLEWDGLVGRISEETIKKTMPPPKPGTLILVCGPDKMMQSICGSPFAVLRAMSGGKTVQPAGANLNNFQDVHGLLGRLGYTKDYVYRF